MGIDFKIGWHFLSDDRTLGHGDGREVRAGETLSIECNPELWKCSLHASKHLIDALRYASGSICCRVIV
jgi:hypothetical protein